MNEEKRRRGDAPGAERATSLLLRLTSKGTKNFGHVLGFREHRVSLRDGGVGVGERSVVSAETRIRGRVPGQRLDQHGRRPRLQLFQFGVESLAVQSSAAQRLRRGVQGGLSGDARDARAVQLPTGELPHLANGVANGSGRARDGRVVTKNLAQRGFLRGE